ncbi:MAG: hypothetical protein AAFU69_00895 [Pseudomonadota bacterium]
MISKEQFETRVDALQEQLQEKLGLRGKSLAHRVQRGGRLLPKHVRRAGQTLIDAEQKISIPRVALQIDHGKVTRAFKTFDEHLSQIDPKARRKAKLLDWLGGLVFNLLLVLGGLFILAWWQGLI